MIRSQRSAQAAGGCPRNAAAPTRRHPPPGAARMALEELCLFGFASLPTDGTGYVFKLMGQDVPGDGYQL